MGFKPVVIGMVRGKLADFSGGIYYRADEEVVISEGRSFLESGAGPFDVVSISMLESFGAAAAGFAGLAESRLYTVEGMEAALSSLRRGGILSLTRMLRTPPKDLFKMLATLAAALKRMGCEPKGCLAVVRSYATATILVAPAGFSPLQLDSVRDFCGSRGFDLVFIPGMAPGEANRFHRLERAVYSDGAARILGGDTEGFIGEYAYNIRPATDDRPYFSDFFRLRGVPAMIRTLGRRWLPQADWGYPALIVALLQSLLAAAVLILLPVRIARPLGSCCRGKTGVFVFFALLGFSYMFLEMAFIQEFSVLLGRPVLAVASSVTAFLLSSSLGSLAAGRLSAERNGAAWRPQW
jgi:hypothetical protein